MTNKISPTPTAAERHILTFSEKIDDLEYRIYTFALSYWLHFLALSSRGFKQKTLLCYPETPKFYHILFVIAHSLGLRLSNDPTKHFDYAIRFEDATFGVVNETTKSLVASGKYINGECIDISKERVEEVFEKVFGYSMAIDPETATGTYVRKSNQNTTHDGVVLTEPTTRESGYIYQKLVDNIEGEWAIDIRVPIIHGVIPCIWKKYKRATDRFDNMHHAKLVKIDEEFTREEVKKLAEFVQEFGIEYAEIDVIRDNISGVMYIVDVNNTASSIHPITHIPAKDYRTTIKEMGSLFEKTFMPKVRSKRLLSDTIS